LRKWIYILLLVLAFVAYRDWTGSDIVHPPGVLVTETPLQQNLANAGPFSIDEYRLTPRASFDIRARVLSTEAYRWDKESDLSPIDLALGWGLMSDQSLLNQLEISQSGRWYYTSYPLPAPAPDRDMMRHSGNMHMIPSEKWIKKELRSLRKGDVIRLRGRLVDVDDPSGWRWRTSLSREDTGAGSCEILYVEYIEVEG
jgi:hypothetical protein